jgi:acetolactate synthase-1/2/3 large subunit
VLVDIPRDVQEAAFGGASADGSAVVPAPPVVATPAAPPPPPVPDPGALRAAVAAIAAAQRPVLYTGGGAQGAAPQLLACAERHGLPVVTTLMGKGAFPESHPLWVGWPGMHGTKTANWALHHADLIVAAGARFDDRVTGRLDAFAPGAKVVHIDIDPREHGKIRHAEIAVHGDLGPVLATLAAAPATPPPTAWHAQLAAWHARFPLGHAPATDDVLKPQQVLQRVAAAVGDRDVVWTTGVGQHQMWAMQYLPTDHPRTFITSGGHGTMGFGLPAAIGARAARPGATVVCVDGDGSFQMTLQELATAVAEELPVVVIILNNGQLGMVHQWQTMFYAERLSHVDLRAAMPDFAALARGFGALGFTVDNAEQLDGALDEALAAGRPAVLDVRTDPGEGCFPMILPGGAAHEQVEWNEPLP